MVYQVGVEFAVEGDIPGHSRTSTPEKNCLMCQTLTFKEDVLPCGHSICRGCQRACPNCPECSENYLDATTASTKSIRAANEASSASSMDHKPSDPTTELLKMFHRNAAEKKQKEQKVGFGNIDSLMDAEALLEKIRMLESKVTQLTKEKETAVVAVELEVKRSTPRKGKKSKLKKGTRKTPDSNAHKSSGWKPYVKPKGVPNTTRKGKKKKKVDAKSHTRNRARTVPSDWKPAKFDDAEKKQDFVQRRSKVGIPVRNTGPRDVERTSDWKPAKYDLNPKKINRSRAKSAGTSPSLPRKEGPRDIGRNKDFQPAKFSTTKVMKKQLSHNEKIHKAGPREIGRIRKDSNWQPAKYDLPEDDGPLFAQRLRYTKSSAELCHEKIYKPGPRDIGWNKDFEAPDYKLEDSGRDFLAPRIDTRRRTQSETGGAGEIGTIHGYGSGNFDHTIRKAGPREIGRLKGWKAAEYEVSNPGEFLTPRIATSHSNSQSVERKLGPREIGRNKEYKVAEYEVQDTGAFLSQRIASSRSLDYSPVEKKLGPREIGRISDWKAAEYDVGDTGEFLSARMSSTRSLNSVPVKKKLGPREIGRVKSWKPAEYDVQDTGEFLDERMSSTRSSNPINVEKKLGPREIGRNTTWKPAKYGTPKALVYSKSLPVERKSSPRQNPRKSNAKDRPGHKRSSNRSPRVKKKSSGQQQSMPRMPSGSSAKDEQKENLHQSDQDLGWIPPKYQPIVEKSAVYEDGVQTRKNSDPTRIGSNESLPEIPGSPKRKWSPTSSGLKRPRPIATKKNTRTKSEFNMKEPNFLIESADHIENIISDF